MGSPQTLFIIDCSCLLILKYISSINIFYLCLCFNHCKILIKLLAHVWALAKDAARGPDLVGVAVAVPHGGHMGAAGATFPGSSVCSAKGLELNGPSSLYLHLECSASAIYCRAGNVQKKTMKMDKWLLFILFHIYTHIDCTPPPKKPSKWLLWWWCC